MVLVLVIDAYSILDTRSVILKHHRISSPSESTLQQSATAWFESDTRFSIQTVIRFMIRTGRQPRHC
jgi:hypothetical protein